MLLPPPCIPGDHGCPRRSRASAPQRIKEHPRVAHALFAGRIGINERVDDVRHVIHAPSHRNSVQRCWVTAAGLRTATTRGQDAGQCELVWAYAGREHATEEVQCFARRLTKVNVGCSTLYFFCPTNCTDGGDHKMK